VRGVQFPSNITNATCTTTAPLSEVDCSSDDRGNAAEGLDGRPGLILYRSATVGTKYYAHTFDFGSVHVADGLTLGGSSFGNWCEGGLRANAPVETCEPDNNFSITVSDDGVSFLAPLGVRTVSDCARLDNGCDFAFNPSAVRYVRLEARSSCPAGGCTNGDKVEYLALATRVAPGSPLSVDGLGRVGVGVGTAAYSLDVSGSLRLSRGSVYLQSDGELPPLTVETAGWERIEPVRVVSASCSATQLPGECVETNCANDDRTNAQYGVGGVSGAITYVYEALV
jgi:hypothetical protein